MDAEEKKQLHMKQAGEYISYIESAKDQIYDGVIKNQLALFVRRFRDLRDLQYWFDSGERELEKLYDRYLPFLNMILENYIKLETSWNFSELEKVKDKLIKTLNEFMDTLQIIMDILPQDEISDATAEAKAKEKKAELDRRFQTVEMK